MSAGLKTWVPCGFVVVIGVWTTDLVWRLTATFGVMFMVTMLCIANQLIELYKERQEAR